MTTLGLQAVITATQCSIGGSCSQSSRLWTARQPQSRPATLSKRPREPGVSLLAATGKLRRANSCLLPSHLSAPDNLLLQGCHV